MKTAGRSPDLSSRMKVKDPNMPTVGLRDVLKAFWQGVIGQRWAFFFTIAAFSASYILRLFPPLYYKKFFDDLSDAAERGMAVPGLVHIILIILVIQLSGWLLFQAGIYVISSLESGVMARLKQNAFEYLIDHSYKFFTNNFSGALVQRINRFSRSFERLFDTLSFNLIPLVIQTVGVTIVVWLEEPLVAKIILAWVAFIVVFSYFFSRWKLKYDLLSAEADSATTARLADTITNQNTVSFFVGAEHEAGAFRDVSNAQAAAQLKTWRFSNVLDGTQAGMIVVIEFLLFYYALGFWAKEAITVGTFVLLQVYVINLAGQLWGFSRVVRNAYEGFSDSKEMVEILKLPHEVQDTPTAKALAVTDGRVTFDNVSFAFNETRMVLNGISLRIKGGEKVALIGPSGAGKSTTVKLLMRMYDLTDGAIRIDGQNIQNVTQNSLRENVSLVPQDPILFHRSLMENIRYGRRDATDKEVIAAAKLAHCDEFIDDLPQKYETLVGERGVKLSGGERQRIAIARAILKNAPILILDEATSSLDSHSEALIQDALDRLMKGKTTIVIAHRLSTIRKMDRIVVIDNGKVIEEGSHDDLLAKDKSMYKNLWNLQAGGFLVE